jgi:hypothetical protein
VEQVLHTLLGIVLLFLASIAVVSGMAIIVLIEAGWIVRLVTRLYWRLRFSIYPTYLAAENSPVGTPQDMSRPEHHPIPNPNGTPSIAESNDGGHGGVECPSE